MKILSRLMALVCVMALFAAPGFAQDIDDYAANLQATLEAAQALTDEFLAISDLETMYNRMYAVVLSETEAPLLNALSAEQVKAISDHANELYLAIEAPDGEDFDTLEMTVDMLSVARNGSEAEMMPMVGVTTTTYSGNVNTATALTVDRETEWILDNATITVNGCITVQAGITLTITGNGKFVRGKNFTGCLFDVKGGTDSKGTLVIEGTSNDKRIVIDGNNVIANSAAIYASGSVNLKNATVQNNKNRKIGTAKDSTVPDGHGGGIRIAGPGSLTMENTTITKNTASANGGGIYSTGNVTAKNCVISDNVAASATTTKPNYGRGGGFHINGSGVNAVFTEVTVVGNTAMYYGGGGQISSNASLTMNDCTMSNNDAILHGAGALHVTGDAFFEMNGGAMIGNTASTVGGAIHSSYKCTLKLNSGRIEGNTAYQRGGGVHINTGGDVTLGDGLIIKENNAYSRGTGIGSSLDDTGDTPFDISYETLKADDNYGYGGGVLIDSGACSVQGATIENNYAAVGGGGIAVVMLNESDSNPGSLELANFEMKSGTIEDNTTKGNGAGVYLMRNVIGEKLANGELKFSEDKIASMLDEVKNGIPTAEIKGGIIQNNEATVDGGGLYLEKNTVFKMTAGMFEENKASNGGAVCVAQGTATISGGFLKKNIASANGGAIWIAGNPDSTEPTITVSNGTIGGDSVEYKNTAVNGGAIYVSNGSFKLVDGTIQNNEATQNGGAVYVSGGSFTMDDGTFTNNEAAQNGGAVYMTGGDFTMYHGIVNSNNAVNGGAVYVTGGNFIMESGTMNSNTALTPDMEAAQTGTKGYGGAVFANGGSITVGKQNCTQNNPVDSHKEGQKTYHPVVQYNEAVFGGAYAVRGGTVTLYCCDMKLNESNNAGTGENIFMDADDDGKGGTVNHYYYGSEIGDMNDHGIVSVGGELNVIHGTDVLKLVINYNSNYSVTYVWEGAAPDGYYLNLPYCPDKWSEDQEKVNRAFVGWTEEPLADDQDAVRRKDQYMPIGKALEMSRLKAEQKGDQLIINFFAVWAPLENKITYAYTVNDVDIQMYKGDDDFIIAESKPTMYKYQNLAYDCVVPDPIKAGYTFKGWRMFASLEEVSNWNADPKYCDCYDAEHVRLCEKDSCTCACHTDQADEQVTKMSYLPNMTWPNRIDLNFGDVYLVAVFEPAFSGLMIAKKLEEGEPTADQNFIYKITGTPDNKNLVWEEIWVNVNAGENQMIYLPVGMYTVTELEDWSWRYEVTDVKQEVKGMQDLHQMMKLTKSTEVPPYAEIKIEDPAQGILLTFTNERVETKWLDGSAYVPNELKKAQ